VRRPITSRQAQGLALATTGLVVVGHLAPSSFVLAQWLPAEPDPRAVPGVCRWRGPRNDRAEVAITFDDGPDPAETIKTLDTLSDLGVRASFFCDGTNVERHPDIVREIADRGHEVGTHGYRHVRHPTRGAGWIVEDTSRAVFVLEEAGVDPSFYRPPYGLLTGASLLAARRFGLETVLWTAWGREWADRDLGSITRRLERRLRPGAIVLLHDSDGQAPAGTAARARAVLARLAGAIEERGLRAVTLPELVRR
jgi:peptidoglycan/xylan/chitin deacetylase (PgdA/CDA1 family)